MSLVDLMPSIQSLSPSEKLHLIQFLAADVAGRMEPSGAEQIPSVAIWSPFDAHEGAATLLQVLNDAKEAD
jgi:hypothetical protein